MKFVLNKLSRFGFNRRILTETDFYSICEKEGIEVLEINVSASFYFFVNGKHFIILKKGLKGLRRTTAMFHELAHYLLHGGSDAANAFYSGLLQNKNEFEADALALIALIPLDALKSFEFLDEHPNRYARKLYRERERLYFLYGI